MGNYEQLKQAISDVIKTNGNQEITGAIMQNALLSIISTVGSNATFAGIATPDTNPGTPDQNVFYIASENGQYVNFDSVVLYNEVAIFTNKNGNWVKNNTGLGTKQELSVLRSKTVGEEYSKNGFRKIEIYSDFLKKDSEIRIKIISCDSESVNIGSFAFYGEGESNYDNIGGYTSLNQTKVVKLQKDYKFLRFYNNIDDSDFSILFEIDSLSLKVERNQDDIKKLLPTIQLSSGEIYTKTSRQLEIVSDFLKKGNFLDLSLIYAKSSTINFGVFAFYGDGSDYYDVIGSFNSKNTQISKVLDKDYKKITIYNNIDDYKEFSVNFHVSNLKIIGNHETEIADIKTEIADINAFIEGVEYEAINSKRMDIPLSYLKQGNALIVDLLECKSSSVNIACFLFYSDSEYDKVQGLGKIGQKNYINLNRDYKFIRFYNNVDLLGYTVRIKYEHQSEETEFKALILGNSYSQGGNWVRGMQEWLNIKSLVNLGVSSATVRDKYQDRITYPYTSRPVSTNNSGNLNTLACQVEKLKRLMQGTDLDPDEVQIYTSESEYPNIIIIEGGMNDTYDNEEKEQTYFSQFEKKVNNVYIKQESTSELTQGSCYIKTPIEETDRTCFAGAYRYIVEELLNIFPKAQIFITTASGLGYWNNSVVERRYRTAEQQRKCANLCAANIIDWSADGQISAILTHPQGSGTEDDPYIWAECTLPNADSSDLMHPNVKGGKKYGHLAALVIKQRFLDIENM